MNAKSLLLLALVATTAACISEAPKTVDTAPPAAEADADTDTDTDTDADSDADTDTDTDTDAPETATSDLDGDLITDSADGVVPYGDFVYVDQGIVASLVNTFLVGWGLGGTDGEYDYCSENLPIERFDAQVDWPESLSLGKVRFFFPDSVEIFFGNPRTFNPGECDTSTDGGYDDWAILENLNGVDEAVCPNPLDGNRLGLYLMKDEDGVFAPGCSGFAVAPDENRDSDNDGTADPDDTTGDGGTDSGTDDGTDSGTVSVSVTKDSSWCAGKSWELWGWNATGWSGNWPGMSTTEYIASGTGDTLSGSLTLASGQYFWMQGECSDGSGWLAESSGEHIASASVGGVSQTVAFSTADDTPSVGTLNKRSSSYDLIGQY